jgi:hypothetical protein
MSTKHVAEPRITRHGVKSFAENDRFLRLMALRPLLLILVLSAAVAAETPTVTTPGTNDASGSSTGGVIQGKILDASGASLSGAQVELISARTGGSYDTRTDAAGSYSFSSLEPGTFTLTVSAQGFDVFKVDRIELASGQKQEIAAILLRVAAVSSTVEVVASRWDVAEAQMKAEEQQRLVGFIPNYYVSYFPHPVALSAGQKMRMAFRLAVDPVNVAFDAAQAGLEANNKNFRDYGTGAEGFSKRFAAAYVTDASGTLIGSGLLPALLHQDPRYHYRGTGSVSSRILYALSWSFRCKGDDGRWQPNYSSLLGNVASTGLANLYLPKAIRDNDVEIVKYGLLSLASQGATALLQEFVFKRLTTHAAQSGKEPKPDASIGSPSPEQDAAPVSSHKR